MNNNAIKLIVLDLDRTLLRTDKSLSQHTVEVLQKCRDKGINIVFATARPKRSILGYMKQFNAGMDLDTWAILHEDFRHEH